MLLSSNRVLFLVTVDFILNFLNFLKKSVSVSSALEKILLIVTLAL